MVKRTRVKAGLDWAAKFRFTRVIARRSTEFLAGRVLGVTLPTKGTLTATKTPRNRLLNSLPADEFERLRPDLEFLDLPQGYVLIKPEVRIDYLYFLEHGLASTDAITKNGRSVEVGVTGREGVVGFHVLLGQPKVSHLTMMQGGGSGFRIRTAAMLREVGNGGQFLRLFHTFLYSHVIQVSQSVLCNRLHEVEHRLARWLLMASDHTESDHLFLTQEFISQMLGSTRSTVTITAGELQEKGLIEYSRGNIRILDRLGLETRRLRMLRGCSRQILRGQPQSG